MTVDLYKGEMVTFKKGDFKGKNGVFRSITGYTNGYGSVCRIGIDGYGDREFTSDFFSFDNESIQETWDTDEIEHSDLEEDDTEHACLNCGEPNNPKNQPVYEDELGKHMVCKTCEASFDIS
ncbi:hypothetical protein IMZ31_22470 (plasmid) [Pontibacillus sp. ALD_SL1]|uniref:hypothetical protein n=1 Tax=Pontibacillus sp. ALD_SL1 TaxID=2777185 RepID=UPI001A95B1DB|nr:hypothetical protein [Pontibacillus sp. ALD_SL1]QST02221.1 hypothetical protein IMZ31_22470 [Pontibacillus sp. ALD_SL1]